MAGGQGSRGSEQKALTWTRWIAHRPGLFFGLGLSVHLLFVVISVILFVSGYNILPIVFDSLPLELKDETMSRRVQAWSMRDLDLDSENSLRRKRDLRDVSDPSGTEADYSMLLSVDDLPTGLQAFQRMTRILTGSTFAPNEEDVYGVVGKEKALEFMGHVDRCCTPSLSVSPFSRRHCTCNPHQRPPDQDQESEYETAPPSRQKRDEALDEFEAYRQRKNRVYEREYMLSSMTLIYEDKKNGNIFTKENLRKIAQFEFDIYNMPDFQKRWCRMSAVFSLRSCQQFTSILRVFDGSYQFADDDLFDPSFSRIHEVGLKALSLSDTEDVMKYLLAADSEVNVTRGYIKSRMTRSQIYFGYPLSGFNDSREQKNIQRNQLSDWMFEVMIPYFKQIHETGVDDLKFYFYGSEFYWREALRAVFGDWIFLVGGVLFIFFFMWFQTGSLFITTFGLFSILTSFVGANLIYCCIVGYKFFGIFNVLAIFIILGIGADDIFIYSDTWRYHLREDFPSLEMRLSSTFKRAALAMFVTSLTTMVAFFVNSFSPLLSVGAFGSFAGITVAVNYISVITYFPAVVTIYHKYFEKKICCCCGETDKVTFNDNASRVSDLAIAESASTTSGVRQASCSDKVNVALSTFFAGKFFRFVTHKVVRIVILLLFILLVSGAIYLATTIKPAERSFTLFNPDNVYEVARNKNEDGFMSNPNDPKVKLQMVWGLGLQDMSMCKDLEYDPLNPCEGKTVWVDDFDLQSEEAQLSLLTFCRKLRHMKAPLKDDLRLANNTVTGENNITCFIEDMADFFAAEASQPWYPAGVNFSLPLTHDKVSLLMKHNPSIYANDSTLYLHRHFETAMQFWLKHRYTNETIPDKRSKFNRYLGWKEVGVRNLATKKTGRFRRQRDMYEVKLRYVGVEIQTTISGMTVGITQALHLMGVWENFTAAQMETLAPQLQKGFQTTFLWSWMKILENLSIQSITACGIGLGLAFVVIFLGTTNVITALWSTLLLISVTVCVIAVIPIAGWTFGLLEALNLCLVVGLAADYIVHFSEAYHMSARTDRLGRLEDTLSKVGVSVLSGAITTLGASFFMLFAELVFFQQFGTFMFCTIGFSMLFSLFVFVAGYSIFGPQGYTGSFLKCCKGRRDYEEQTVSTGAPPGEKQQSGFDNTAYEDEISKM